MLESPNRTRRTRRAGLCELPTRARRHHPDFNARETRGWKSIEAEGKLSTDGWRREQKWALDMGLPGAESLTDKSIPTFARGELPHFAGINTFLKAPYVENVRDVAKYDAAVVGIPFDSGTTYRPGTRFGPQGIRRISALYTPYNYELGVDLREQMTLCDAGDVFTIPGNLEKSFDQISRGVAHIFSSGALPLMLGGDHSIGFPCVRGIAQCTSKRIGIIHIDRHIDIQERDLDERMHTTPWYWATNLANVPAVNLVQVGIGGWQVPRDGVAEARKRQTNVLTIQDVEQLGLEKTAEIALELAWKDADAVYISFDIDSVDCGFVPGTGWPEPGGFLPREALKLLGLVCAPGICGLEVVEVSPPYDTSDITALLGVRVVVEALGSMVAHGTLGKHKAIIDKPVAYEEVTLMHGSHPHNHHHHHDDHRHEGVSGYGLRPAAGHNEAGRLAQWQEPGLPRHEESGEPEPDFDLIEKSFAESFPRASDPTSFLRLARIPFVGGHPDGRVLRLLRVEYDEATDVGALTPRLGGGSARYDPLPAQMVSVRRRLRFVYQDGAGTARLSLAETRILEPVDEPGTPE